MPGDEEELEALSPEIAAALRAFQARGTGSLSLTLDGTSPAKIAVGGYDRVLLAEAQRGAQRAAEAHVAGDAGLQAGATASAVLAALRLARHGFRNTSPGSSFMSTGSPQNSRPCVANETLESSGGNYLPFVHPRSKQGSLEFSSNSGASSKFGTISLTGTPASPQRGPCPRGSRTVYAKRSFQLELRLGRLDLRCIRSRGRVLGMCHRARLAQSK